MDYTVSVDLMRARETCCGPGRMGRGRNLDDRRTGARGTRAPRRRLRRRLRPQAGLSRPGRGPGHLRGARPGRDLRRPGSGRGVRAVRAGRGAPVRARDGGGRLAGHDRGAPRARPPPRGWRTWTASGPGSSATTTPARPRTACTPATRCTSCPTSGRRWPWTGSRACMRPGGVLRLRDLIYDFAPAEAAGVFQRWFDHAASDPADGYTARTTPSTSAPSSARSGGCWSRCWPRPASRS